MKANNILFRCSALSKLMVEPQSKSELIAKGVTTHLIDIYASFEYGRHEDVDSKYLAKGNAREEDAITLLSRTKKRMFKKNEDSLMNEFIKGTPDLFTGEKIYAADETLDTKCSYSLHTFLRSVHSKLDNSYYWQGQGYMWLTGAKKHTVAFCLVNNTVEGIEAEYRRLSYKPGMVDYYGNETPLYLEKKKQIEINNIFDRNEFELELEKTGKHYEFQVSKSDWKYDIPHQKRIFTFEFERNEADIERLKNRIILCRNWINENLYEKDSK